MKSKGKLFEKKFLEDFKKTFNPSFLYRLPDQLSGYKGTSSNICDFLAFGNSCLYLIETKTHTGNTWPFSNFSQYTKMKEYVDKSGVRVGVVLWMIDHDLLMYIPVKTIEKMKLENKKSVNIKDLNNPNYRIIEIPSKKKITFLSSDYSILKNLKEGD